MIGIEPESASLRRFSRQSQLASSPYLETPARSDRVGGPVTRSMRRPADGEHGGDQLVQRPGQVALGGQDNLLIDAKMADRRPRSRAVERRGSQGADNQVRRRRTRPGVPMMISYDLAGTGPALALLHSTVCDRRMRDPQWPVLADAGYPVARCDFRGFGETPVPQGPHNDADDVLDLLDELGIGPVAVAGASYGGKVALEIAARRPRRVAALALVCAGMPGH